MLLELIQISHAALWLVQAKWRKVLPNVRSWRVSDRWPRGVRSSRFAVAKVQLARRCQRWESTRWTWRRLRWGKPQKNGVKALRCTNLDIENYEPMDVLLKMVISHIHVSLMVYCFTCFRNRLNLYLNVYILLYVYCIEENLLGLRMYREPENI